MIEELMVDFLMEYELSIEGILPSLISPFPYNDIMKKIEQSSTIIFIEESPVSYGWSSEIVAHLSEIGSLDNKNFTRN